MTNGAGRRKLGSWIESFVDHASNLESAPIFRKWAAIGTIAAALEQKVWLQTSAPLYPNLYIFLVGHPGVGKTRTIMACAKFYRELPDFHLSPTSMSMASMVDALVDAKRTIIRLPQGPLEYNSMFIVADELSAFMHKFDEEIIGGLTTFYDTTTPYAQRRRGNDIKILIKHPQLSILSGTTPSNLIKFMPENAWDQGFTSRVIMVFSDERIISDDFFAQSARDLPADMVHDLSLINSLSGSFEATEDYRAAINNWRKLGQEPVPNHPKLTHYNTRRLAHLLKLSMIAAVDSGNQLLLTKEVFNKAMGWLLEAEMYMPEIFKAGAIGADSKAMDEIFHYVLASDLKRLGILEHKIVNFARERVPAHSVMRVLEIMERSGMLEKSTGMDPATGQFTWRAVIAAKD
jgi:hypothetical protein